MDGTTVLLTVAAFTAGLIDSIAGGGGLIQLPALFAALPNLPPATLLGTNKFASLMGTTSSLMHYARAVPLAWRLLIPLAACAFASSFLGSLTMSQVSANVFRPMVPVTLLLLLAYITFRKDLGQRHAPCELSASVIAGGICWVSVIGFYDGFFGPGAGSFLMILFIRYFGFDFLNAAASARLVNAATNAASLCWFGTHHEVLWALGGTLAIANIAGSQLGARLALRRGSGFVRHIFMAIVSALIVKTGWDAWLRLQHG